MAVTLKTLPNRLRFILAPQPSALTAAAYVLVAAGSEYETKKINGLSHFLEHLCFKGTSTRPRLGETAEALDGLGAEYNAFTDQEWTGYYAKGEYKKLPSILEIIADLYLNPLFLQEEIEKERGVVIEELNLYEDTPSRRVYEIFNHALFGDQPAGWDVGGKKEIIRRISREEILTYRSAHYHAASTIVVVAGRFSLREVEQQIKKLFHSLPRKRLVKKAETKVLKHRPSLELKYKESDQTHMVLGFRGLDFYNVKRPAAIVMSNILGGGMSSRLWKRIREDLGAAYYVHEAADYSLDHGHLGIAAGVTHEKLVPALRAILEECARLKGEKVPAAELERNKNHIAGHFVLGLESADSLAHFYGWQALAGQKLKTPEEAIAAIRKVTAEDIRAVAREVFKEDRLALALVGPHKNPAAFSRLLHLP